MNNCNQIIKTKLFKGIRYNKVITKYISKFYVKYWTYIYFFLKIFGIFPFHYRLIYSYGMIE